MSRPSGRRSRRKQLQTSHQKNWLTGLHAVQETLTADIWPIRQLYLEDDLNSFDIEQLRQMAKSLDVPCSAVSRDRLTELCHSRHHQGAAARMGDYPFKSLNDLKSMLQASGDLTPLVAVCDRIMDAHNFGAILRCCDAMKVCAVIIGETEQVGVTPHVARTSAGAVNYVPVISTEHLPDACDLLKSLGQTLAAASEKADTVVWETNLNRPVSLIIGNEAQGISAELWKHCDLHLRIPMMGGGTSLNAAVAAGTLLYEIRRQQSVG